MTGCCFTIDFTNSSNSNNDNNVKLINCPHNHYEFVNPLNKTIQGSAKVG